MRIDVRRFLGILLLALPFLLAFFATRASADGATFRWDLIHLSSFSPMTVEPGGQASALANDGSQITLTGSGTFVVGEPDEVTGGGTWQLTCGSDPGITCPASGTYVVKRLVRFTLAPGVQASTVVDTIGPLTDQRGGLAFLSIAYSHGSKGVLVVSCHLGGTPSTPASVFEGITASKDFVDFWNREAPAPGVDGNRTNFHVVSEEDEQ